MSPSLRLHPRLLFAVLIGIGAYVLLRADRGTLTAGLVAWNVGCWSWIALMGWMMSRRHAQRIREMATAEDMGAWLALLFVCIAAGVSLVAIVLELSSARDHPGASSALHFLLAFFTVAGSWLAVGIAFSSHYAHLYYTSSEAKPPLRFPDELAAPGYWDFIYFAFTIAVAAQTSDVTIVTTEMRKVVVAQSVLGFVFNAAIIGFSINVFAGAVGR